MGKQEQESQNKQDQTPTTARSRKGVMAASGVGALLLITGVPAGYYMFRGEAPKVEEVSVELPEQSHGKLEGADDAVELEEGEEALGAIVPLETFLLNLSGGKYIRVQMQLEFEGLDVPSRLYTRMVPIRDGIISYITRQSSEDLNTIKGKESLKSSIRKLINDALHKEDVRRVYFTQFVIQ